MSYARMNLKKPSYTLSPPIFTVSKTNECLINKLMI